MAIVLVTAFIVVGVLATNAYVVQDSHIRKVDEFASGSQRQHNLLDYTHQCVSYDRVVDGHLFCQLSIPTSLNVSFTNIPGDKSPFSVTACQDIGCKGPGVTWDVTQNPQKINMTGMWFKGQGESICSPYVGMMQPSRDCEYDEHTGPNTCTKAAQGKFGLYCTVRYDKVDPSATIVASGAPPSYDHFFGTFFYDHSMMCWVSKTVEMFFCARYHQDPPITGNVELEDQQFLPAWPGQEPEKLLKQDNGAFEEAEEQLEEYEDEEELKLMMEEDKEDVEEEEEEEEIKGGGPHLGFFRAPLSVFEDSNGPTLGSASDDPSGGAEQQTGHFYDYEDEDLPEDDDPPKKNSGGNLP